MSELKVQMPSEEDYIAFHGFAYLKGASDTHKNGLQIQLQLGHEKDYRVFKGFRKHRKGKSGSGLYRAFTRRVLFRLPDSKTDGSPWYGPVDLKFLRWTVSSANGAVVTFEIEDYVEWRKMRDAPALDAGYAPEGMDRTEVMLVELDNESKPVNVTQRAKLERMARKRKWPKGGAQSKRAALLCQEGDFRAWVFERTGGVWGAETQDTAEWMRKECDLDTRAQLDHDPAALQRFEDRVTRPYLRSLM